MRLSVLPVDIENCFPFVGGFELLHHCANTIIHTRFKRTSNVLAFDVQNQTTEPPTTTTNAPAFGS